jgi:GNAT superfamily N-acetyltransferase
VNITIRATDSADDRVRKAIVDPLIAYNTSRTGRSDMRLLILAVEDEHGAVVGGLWGRTALDWLFVELLFVPETLRGRGIGTDLLRRAEAEALVRGCHGAWLDTFEFQARGFYERLGYRCFGELEGYPADSKRYFMRKALTA